MFQQPPISIFYISGLSSGFEEKSVSYKENIQTWPKHSKVPQDTKKKDYRGKVKFWNGKKKKRNEVHLDKRCPHKDIDFRDLSKLLVGEMVS